MNFRHSISSTLQLLWSNSLWLSMACLNFSTALSSIFIGLFFLHVLLGKSIWKNIQSDDLLNRKGGVNLESMRVVGILGLLLFAVIVGVSMVKGNGFASVIQYLQIKLPLIFLLLVFVMQRRIEVHTPGWWVFLLFPNFWIVTASCIHYFQHLDFYSAMVLESKPIPMFTQVYHIEYGAIVAISLLIFGECLLSNPRIVKNKNLAIVIAGITLVGLHVLALRTGLIMFYAGLVFIWIKNGAQLGNGIIKPLYFKLTFLLLLMLSLSIPSVRHRIDNSIEDVKAIVRGGDKNHKSVGQRVEAWKAAITAIQSNPMGVGVSGEFDALMKGYDRNESTLTTTHRIGIHNQFLQVGLQGGVISLLLILGWLMYGVWKLDRGYWLVVLTAGLLVESFFERQAGILITVVTLLAALGFSADREEEREIKTQ